MAKKKTVKKTSKKTPKKSGKKAPKKAAKKTAAKTRKKSPPKKTAPPREIAIVSSGMKYQDVTDHIVGMIQEKNLYDTYLAPERDLAETYGVSRDTIRRALELLQSRGIVSRTQGRGTYVLGKTEKKQISGAARIAVVYCEPAGSGSFSCDILAGIADRAAREDWALSFALLDNEASRKHFFEDLPQARYDGVLLVSCKDRGLVEELFRLWGGPAVLADHSFEDIPVTSVRDDSESGARKVMEHLLSLGHRRIGYVDDSQRELNPWRYAGYAGALKNAGIELDPDLVVPAFGSFAAGIGAGDKLLFVKPRPTAVFAYDDVRAWGVWRAAEMQEIEAGTELALAGYGDLAAKNGFPEELTSVSVDSHQIGVVAVEKLAGLLKGEGRPGELCLVPTELIVRSSTEESRKG